MKRGLQKGPKAGNYSRKAAENAKREEVKGGAFSGEEAGVEGERFGFGNGELFEVGVGGVNEIVGFAGDHAGQGKDGGPGSFHPAIADGFGRGGWRLGAPVVGQVFDGEDFKEFFVKLNLNGDIFEGEGR